MSELHFQAIVSDDAAVSTGARRRRVIVAEAEACAALQRYTDDGRDFIAVIVAAWSGGGKSA